MVKSINKYALENIELRGHHILCLLGFRGLGYSPAFIENMSNVANKIFKPNNFIITLTTKEDTICKKCPHNKNHKCFQSGNVEKEVKNKDIDVLKRLHFSNGMNILTKELWAAVNENIYPRDLRALCRNCKWFKDNFCIEGLKKLKKNRGGKR